MNAKGLHIATEQPGTVEISQLETLLEEHPYFTAAWVKLLLEYRALGKEDMVNELITKVAAMAPDRSILKKRLEAVLLLKMERKAPVDSQPQEKAGEQHKREEPEKEIPLAGQPHEEKDIHSEEKERALAEGANADLQHAEAHSFTEWLHYLQEHPAGKQDEEKTGTIKEDEDAIIDAGALHEARYQMEAAKLAESEADRDEEEEEETLPDGALDEAKEMAAKSLTLDDSLVSETLAQVYVIQGKKEKAIEIYQRLIQKTPERSSYFIAQIKKLKES